MFVPNITVSQSAITPESVTISDVSTGSDVAITQRRVTMTNAYSDFLTGNGSVNYNEWSYVLPSITLSVLTQDTACNVLVEWLDSGNNVLYSYNNNYPLSQFGKQFFYALVQQQGLTPGIYQDTNYSSNLAIFWSNVVAGDNAVSYGNDIQAAQECYNREIQMQENQSSYF